MSLTHRSPGVPDRRSRLRRTWPLAALALAVGVGLGSAGLSACSGSSAHPAAGDTPAGTASAAASPSPGLSDTAAENAKPGTNAWSIPASAIGPQNAIQGYTDQASVTPGQSFKLFVSTTAPSFTATAYRIGYYGGANGREVWQSPSTPGKHQTAQTIAPGTHTVECNWSPSMTVPTQSWPPGDYLIKLVASNGTGQRYVPITVRSTDTTGKIILVAGVTTWQAYNAWGGYSLYHGPSGGPSDRARAVSFDRPYLDPDEEAADGLFFPFDQALVSFAEQHNLPVAYETDVELETEPAQFTHAAGIVSDGHDEYYSATMRQTLTAARDAGANLAFLGANAIFRHIRWGSTQLGADRLIICYKDAASDPMYATDKTQTTQDWRDEPDPRPENTLTGAYYQCNPVDAPYVVYDPTNWIFAGTGATKGEKFPGLVGPEYDRVVDIATTPHPIEVLSHSALTCDGHASYQESAYYTTSSGAGVFDAGTMRWECALGSQCSSHLNAADRAFVRTATLNLLTAFGQGPVGKAHPANDNTAADGVPHSGGLGID
ncbi:N,N-dimethylformamidase beta subunit family domain-containing protein [Actinocrinis sp.]|uniref:N,N-dimethylformamidase beta subunit family domain-containing protein n=1 Tax=Actinocrinis sp. TaxID=1920516 RepID=UPI002CB1105F|nr:N,N-dimethylformamidase beta subunit family domain-containing protein [Actinocrinis sp.]HXR73598.1 N,N-dimethylformamidase beta subunit family domain-containing protein [Actinocrinis sp.]